MHDRFGALAFLNLASRRFSVLTCSSVSKMSCLEYAMSYIEDIKRAFAPFVASTWFHLFIGSLLVITTLLRVGSPSLGSTNLGSTSLRGTSLRSTSLRGTSLRSTSLR